MIIPFSFAFVPELLLLGSPAEVAHAAIAYLLGNLALAMGLQGMEFVRGQLTPWRRALFFVAAFFLLFPTGLAMDIAGLSVMALAWGPSFKPRRLTA
jgi:TRAP-type uncharacterized transport system fused permease subunit